VADSAHAAGLALLAGAVALYGLWQFCVRLRRDRVVADTPAAHLRSAAQGYVKVSGRVGPAGAAPTAAPLSGRPCVWWSFEVAAEERDSRGRVHWNTTERASSVELFTLTDADGGSCLVGPVAAEVTPSVRSVWYGSSPRPATPPPPLNLPMLNGGWRYTEQLLAVGEQVCVLGELQSHSETGDVAAAAAAKLRSWKQNQSLLLQRFDTNHDGRIDAQEWERVRQAAADEAQAQVLQQGITRVSVIGEPRNGEPFLIAPRNAAQLERRERIYAALYFFIGLGGAICCAWAIGRVA
jgi:EF hand